MLLEKTRNGSSVTAKTAGMESRAKTRSVVSAATSASRSGGGQVVLPRRTKKWEPSRLFVIGNFFATQRTTALSAGCAASSSLWKRIFLAVETRTAAKT